MLQLALVFALFMIGWSATGGILVWAGLVMAGHTMASALVIAISVGVASLSLLRLLSHLVPPSLVARRIFPGAQPVSLGHSVADRLDALCHAAEAERPRLFVYPGEGVNAAAAHVGGANGVFVSAPALRLPPNELAFLLAHELAHLIHRDHGVLTLQGGMLGVLRLGDMLFSAVHTVLAGLPGVFRGFVTLLRAWHWASTYAFQFASGMLFPIFRAFSRASEYRADAFAAQLVSPSAGVALLSRFSSTSRFALFSTHPTIENRIKRLLELPPPFHPPR